MLTLAAPPDRRPVLVLAVGNPSRGDDALGPLLAERIAALGLPEVEVLVEFQLQVEHALDLFGRSEVYFVDATASGDAGVQLASVAPRADASISSHALSPAALLHLAGRLAAGALPGAHVLAIRGSDFGLGRPLSVSARGNLEQAFALLRRRLAAPRAASQAADDCGVELSAGPAEAGDGANAAASFVAGGG